MIACESMMSKGYGSLVLNFKELLVGYVTLGEEYFWTSGLHIRWKQEIDSFSLW
jgi:hypothetical protein